VRRTSLLLLEAAKGPQDLPDGVFVAMRDFSHGVFIYYANKDGSLSSSPKGRVAIKLPDPGSGVGKCFGAFYVSSASADRGWGPLLYDIALEYASKQGGGLTADRASVSSAAERVWDYYLTKRRDVKWKQLDDLKNTLTTTTADNCKQKAASIASLDWMKGKVVGKRPGFEWSGKRNPLSKVFIKAPQKITKALEKAGKLVRL